MTDQTPQARQSGPSTDQGSTSAPTGAPPRSIELPGKRPPGPRPADAGAVLRRSPDPDSPGSWRVAPLRPRPSIVDTTDGNPSPVTASGPSSSIVDTTDTRPASRPVPPLRPGRPVPPRPIVDTPDRQTATGHGSGPHSSIVDTPDRNASSLRGGGIFRRPIVDTTGGREGSSSIVDTTDSFEDMPAPAAEAAAAPVPTRLKGPDARKVSGPSGPDDALMKKLREAHKRRVADRAKSRGRDPGAGSKEVTEGVTRSAKTHEQYLERGRMLMQRFRRETGRGDASLDTLNPVEFVNWLFSLKPGLKPATWRPYRQSAKAILSSIPHDDTEAAIAMIDADVAEPENAPEKKESALAESATRDKLPRRTSALKEKRFPKDDFDKIVSYLRHFSRSKFAPVLADWLIAGVATGLRPIEWQATDLEIREDPNAPGGRWVWLYVLNAKATNGRANGIVRTLDLSHFRDETLRSVQKMSQLGNEWLLNGTFDSMQSQCAQLLYSVSEKLFRGRRKIYSLYSARHQFVANAKSYHKPEAVSALVGHVVTDTAVSSYGKKRSCWAPEDIRDRADPVAEEVATVRQRLVFFEERVRLQQEAGLLKAPKAAAGEEA